MRNLRFVLHLMKRKAQRTMAYRFSFFSGSFVDSSLFFLWLVMFEAIYSETEAIGGWNKGQMVIFLGTFSLLNAINMVLYFFGTIRIPQLIVSGGLDEYVTKPVNALLRISFEEINLGSLPLIPVSLCIIGSGISQAGIALTAGNCALYAAFVLLMAVLYYDIEVFLRTLPFFAPSATAAVEQFEGAALEMCMRVPGTLYHGAMKFLFYLVIPYGILATVPTQILTGEAGLWLLLWSAGVVAGFTALTLWLWKQGLRRYCSTGS